MAKNRVLYLVSRENVLEPGVLKSQVLDLAGQIVADSSDTEITVLNFPSFNRFLANLGNFRSVTRHSRSLGIRLLIVPILPIGRSFMPVWAIPFFLVQTVPWVLFFGLRYRINIIHARAYLSALIVHLLRQIGFRAGFVFDMRGAYLLEGLTYGRWQKSDANYKSWEDIERNLFSSADRVVVQSSGLVNYAKRVAPNAKLELIPPGVDEHSFAMSEKDREQMRGEFGIKDRFILVYSGSLGSFHEPEFLAKRYSEIRRYLPNPYFLVVTHSDSKELVNYLQKWGVTKDEFRIIPSPKDLGKVIPLGDAGLHIMDDLPITSTVVSVKLGEYLAAGLPVVVTENMASVTNLVNENRCGVVLSEFDRKDTRVKMQKLVKERETIKRNALKLAKDYFSVRICANKYLKIYEEFNPKSKS